MSEPGPEGANKTVPITTIAVIAANFVTVILVLVFQFYIDDAANRTQEDWNRVSTENFETLSALGDTQRLLGFGGMIHNFKNYVLRGEQRYYDTTSEVVAALKTNLDGLRGRFRDVEEQQALTDIERVVNLYRLNLELATSERIDTDAETLDSLVRIDDAPALEAIAFLTQYTRDRLQSQQQALITATEERLALLRFGYLAVLLLLATSLAYLGLLRRQQRNNRDLSNALERIDNLLNATPDPLIIVAEDGTIERANREASKAFGYGDVSLAGMSVEDLVPTEFREGHVHQRARYLDSGGQHVMHRFPTLEGLRKDGTQFPMEAQLSTLEMDGKRLVTVGIRDITERQRMEQELQRGQRMQAVGQLTGGIAHDFNNLLQIVSGNAQLIQSGIGDPKEAADNIEEATAKASVLTTQLQAFGRQQSLHPKVTAPAELLAKIGRLIGRTAGDLIDLRMDIGDDLPNIHIDRGQLENAILNLVINARDVMPDGGKLIIEASRRDLDSPTGDGDLIGECVLISVSDTGPGIPDEIVHKVMEPFFSTKGVGEGSGLGLSMVHGFVAQSGGAIRIETDAGVGTSVQLFLPAWDGSAVQETQQEAAPESEPEPAPVSAPVPAELEPKASDEPTPTHILVLEDEEGVRQLATAILEHAGYRVSSAEDANEADAVFGDGADFDMIFSDIMLPGGRTGIDFARGAREKRPDIPILFASGYSQDLIEDASILDETGGLLRKPYRRDQLIERTRAVLGE